MYKLLTYLLIIWLTAGSLSGNAQQITISEPLSLQDDISYDFLGKYNNNLLLFREKSMSCEVQAYDENLKLSWKKEIFLDKRRPNVVGVVGLKTAFYVLYTFESKRNKVLKIHKYDPNCVLLDSFSIKDYSRGYDWSVPSMIISDDKNCLYVYNKKTEDYQIYDGLVFQLNTSKVLWDKAVFLTEQLEEKRFNPILLSNEGKAYFISERDNAKLEKHRIEIVEVSQSVENKTWSIPFDQNYTYDIKYAIDNQNRRMQAVGLTGDKALSRAKGIFHFSMLLSDSSHQFLINQYPFTDSTVSALLGKKLSQNKGLPDVIVDQIILRKDGGLIGIIEQRKVVERRILTSRGGFGNENYLPVYDHYNENLLLNSFHPDGRVHWQTILNKSQFSSEDQGIYNSYFLMKTAANIRLLYNDEVKENTTISEYVVAGSGDFDRNSIMTTEKKDLRMRFKDGIQLTSNEAIIPSEHRNKLKLVRIRF